MQEFSENITKIVTSLYGITPSTITVMRPEGQYGDYATNIAMQITKQVGKPPRTIAEEIVSELQQQAGDWLQDASVAGPGFINASVTNDSLLRQALAMPIHQNINNENSNKVIVIETNNPNPFKAMHIGHAFNAILADTIANLIDKSGAEVHRVSYHGDVGAHVGKSMYAILRFIDGDINKLHAIIPEDRNAFMSKMYAEGAKAASEDEGVAAAVQKLADQSFSLDDPLFNDVYLTCKKWSFELIAQTVERLGNKPVEKRYLESEADAIGVKTVQNNIGSVFTKSQGAIIFDGEPYGVFTNVFISSKGRGLYAARDLGLMQLKNADFHADKSYIVTAVEQKDYFKGVIVAAELALPELKDVTVNISTGTVKLSTGKMSSRSGDVLDIAWLFEQITSAIEERGGEPTSDAIVGSLRYQFLRVRIGSDVIFDVNEAVSLQGNSGPYLQYAHARACSIIAKAGEAGHILSDIDSSERTLLKKLTEYEEVVTHSCKDLSPHIICTYLFELAQEFNRFYEQNKVIGDPRQSQRLALVEMYARVLRDGLNILSIPAPEQM